MDGQTDEPKNKVLPMSKDRTEKKNKQNLRPAITKVAVESGMVII
jgi:hypothetical protein